MSVVNELIISFMGGFLNIFPFDFADRGASGTAYPSLSCAWVGLDC